MIVANSLIFDVTIIIIAATILAYIAHNLKQPLIPGYVLAGILIGPYGFALVTNLELMATLSELGIALLLFIVGMEMSLSRLKKVGVASSAIGVAQVLIVTIVGYFIAIYIGFGQMEAFYIGLILAFSSTMVVIKLLSDKGVLDTLHGKLTLGILLVQDIIVIFVMSLLLNINNTGLDIISTTVIKGLGLLAISIIFSKYILPHLLKGVTDSPELLFLFSLSWCFLFAALAFFSGFSIAIGAFIAGVGLATFPYNLEIISRMKSLKDFFVTIFFVTLGVAVIPAITTAVLYPLMFFIVIAILFKPVITMLLCSAFKYGPRTSFLTSNGLGQISEFSLILATQGLLLGHISQELFSLTIIATVITITITSYFIKHDAFLFNKLSKSLTFFGRETHEQRMLEHIPEKLKGHVVVLGCDRMGSRIVRTLLKQRENFIVIDYNPDIIHTLVEQEIPSIYGDVGDVDILDRVNIKKAKLVISTIPNEGDNLLVIDYLRENKKTKPRVFAVASSTDQAIELYHIGADYVIIPKMLCGEEVAEILEVFGLSDIDKLKEEHIQLLNRLIDEEIIRRYEPKLTMLREKLKRKKEKRKRK